MRSNFREIPEYLKLMQQLGMISVALQTMELSPENTGRVPTLEADEALTDRCEVEELHAMLRDVLPHFHESGEWVAYLFPRGKHRPEVFHTGELTVSPASIDLCGIFVVPLAQDFERITGDAIAAIFREVTLPDGQFQEVAGKLESER